MIYQWKMTMNNLIAINNENKRECLFVGGIFDGQKVMVVNSVIGECMAYTEVGGKKKQLYVEKEFNVFHFKEDMKL